MKQPISDAHAQQVTRIFIPKILRELLSRNLIDLAKTHDIEYLWSVVTDPKNDVVDDLQLLTEIHGEFKEIAEYAISNGKKHVAVILLATTVEHSLNLYYREMLNLKHLTTSEITEIIRRSDINGKLGWLMSIVGNINLEHGFINDLMKLFEVRNAIVHYKAIPGKLSLHDGSDDKIKAILDQIDLPETLNLLNELEKRLEVGLNEADPNRRMAIEFAHAMLVADSS